MVKAPIIYIAVRDVEIEECHWLHKPVKKGEILYGYSGPTYGCIGAGSVVTRDQQGNTPFFELPSDAIKRIEF